MTARSGAIRGYSGITVARLSEGGMCLRTAGSTTGSPRPASPSTSTPPTATGVRERPALRRQRDVSSSPRHRGRGRPPRPARTDGPARQGHRRARLRLLALPLVEAAPRRPLGASTPHRVPPGNRPPRGRRARPTPPRSPKPGGSPRAAAPKRSRRPPARSRDRGRAAVGAPARLPTDEQQGRSADPRTSALTTATWVHLALTSSTRAVRAQRRVDHRARVRLARRASSAVPRSRCRLKGPGPSLVRCPCAETRCVCGSRPAHRVSRDSPDTTLGSSPRRTRPRGGRGL